VKVKLGATSGLGRRGEIVEVSKALGEALVSSDRATKIATRGSTKADEAPTKEGD